ncbi:MAG: hypothetical protein KatS3mg111_2293 [Pirellulaceae bacterium]|nr:MAG: hypothetical protein KatS3mg111_2293 [Pirellulaceae bacterium]
MTRCSLIGLLTFLATSSFALGQSSSRFVPGTGVELSQVGDDFEDPQWDWIPNNPKSTEDINERQNPPFGKSTNGRWYEGVKRGHPDIVKRVPTPPGGLPGSEGALLLQSLYTGIPNRPSNRMHQEDFICNVQYRIGGPISASQEPSVVTRIYLPPIEQWERRSGPHFAFRIALETTKTEVKQRFLFTSRSTENEVYWPGLFILMDTKEKTGKPYDSIYFRIRANPNGGDFLGPEIKQTGWWTLGMSISADGAVHYYARPGVGDLTAEDHIASQYPYGYRCERFRSAFFNVVNGDNGRDWTSPLIIDDTQVFVRNPGRRFATGERIQR